MIPDQLLQLWSGAVPAYNSASNSIDIDTLRNIGVGTPIYVRINFDTNVRADSNGSGLAFFLVYADNAALTSNVRYLTSTNVLFGTATGPDAKEVLYIQIPPVSHYAEQGQAFSTPDNAKKFFGVVFAGYGWSSASGSVTIDLVTEINRVENIYAKGFTVQ